MKDLPEQALNDIASYFQALSDPTRLKILNLLRDRPHNVGSSRNSLATPLPTCPDIWLRWRNAASCLGRAVEPVLSIASLTRRSTRCAILSAAISRVTTSGRHLPGP